MVGSELRLATFKYLLCKINLYEQSILHHGYEKLGTGKNKKRFDDLRNSINGEVSQILNELKTEGVDPPREDFLWESL